MPEDRARGISRPQISSCWRKVGCSERNHTFSHWSEFIVYCVKQRNSVTVNRAQDYFSSLMTLKIDFRISHKVPAYYETVQSSVGTHYSIWRVT